MVQRACGYYIVGTSYDIKTTIKEIYEIMLEVMKEMELKNIKVMIGGPVTHIFPPGSGLYDAKFTRGLVEIETTGFDFGKEFESEHDGLNKVIRIHKYTPAKQGCYSDNEQSKLDTDEAALA